MVTQCFASPKSIATVAKIAECHTLHDPPMECNGLTGPWPQPWRLAWWCLWWRPWDSFLRSDVDQLKLWIFWQSDWRRLDRQSWTQRKGLDKAPSAGVKEHEKIWKACKLVSFGSVRRQGASNATTRRCTFCLAFLEKSLKRKVLEVLKCLYDWLSGACKRNSALYRPSVPASWTQPWARRRWEA